MFKGLGHSLWGHYWTYHTEPGSIMLTSYIYGRQWEKLQARGQQKGAFLLSRLRVKCHNQCLVEQKTEGKSLSNTKLQSDHTSMITAEFVCERKESSHVGSLGWFSYPGSYVEIAGEECIIQECKTISCSNRPQGFVVKKKILQESRNVKRASKVINVACWGQRDTSSQMSCCFYPMEAGCWGGAMKWKHLAAVTEGCGEESFSSWLHSDARSRGERSCPSVEIIHSCSFTAFYERTYHNTAPSASK